jgi:hypothetical protein
VVRLRAGDIDSEGTVLDDGEDVISPRASTAVKRPTVATGASPISRLHIFGPPNPAPARFSGQV